MLDEENRRRLRELVARIDTEENCEKFAKLVAELNSLLDKHKAGSNQHAKSSGK